MLPDHFHGRVSEERLSAGVKGGNDSFVIGGDNGDIRRTIKDGL